MKVKTWILNNECKILMASWSQIISGYCLYSLRVDVRIWKPSVTTNRALAVWFIFEKFCLGIYITGINWRFISVWEMKLCQLLNKSKTKIGASYTFYPWFWPYLVTSRSLYHRYLHQSLSMFCDQSFFSPRHVSEV